MLGRATGKSRLRRETSRGSFRKSGWHCSRVVQVSTDAEEGGKTLRRIFVALFIGAVLAVASLTPALAARNPSGTGQPGAECGEPGATTEPSGFLTGGFAHAETVYAGSEGTPSAANGNPKAVSQYDVACYQVTS